MPRPRRVLTSLCLLLGSGAAAAGDWNASLVAASDYVEHGLTRSLGKASLRAEVDWYGARGFGVGVEAATLNLNIGPGPTHEWGVYLRQSWRPSNDWQLTTSLAKYDFGREPLPTFTYDYSELKLAANWRGLWRLEAGYSPDYSRFSRRGVAYRRDALSYVSSVNYPVARGVTLFGGVGHYDLRDLFGAGYWFWSGGCEIATGGATVSVSYVGSDNTAKQLFGDRTAGQRLVVAVAWRGQRPGR